MSITAEQITAIIEQDIADAYDLAHAVANVEKTGAALLESYRRLNLLKVSHQLEDLAPCTRPNLIGWLEVKIDELKESGAPEGMTPAEALKAEYLKWVAH
ncbi:hypothetical protein [Stutzerimonas kunmingensis]|uniref:hypothetical protein n=1 Tax=Stutzerimonas kunmingensis TaxID=1211807 RepID=UPI0028A6B9B4|nr:hypothetical protein [Stutzerimonas kunmingensis]